MAFKKNNVAHKIIDSLKEGKIEEALQVLKNSEKNEQLKMFSMISKVLIDSSLKDSLDVKPQMLSVLRRDLIPGKTYEDFAEAWFPEVESSDGYHTFEYYDVPVQVINAQNISNESEVLSIGLVGVGQEKLMATSGRFKELDKKRQERVVQVTENGTVALFKVRGVYTLGK